LELQMLSGGTKISTVSASAERELENLINAHGTAVLKYCHSILMDYYEAQDVVQSVYTTALTALRRGKEINSSWLYKAGYNLCIDILRRKKLQRIFSITKEEPAYTENYFIGEEVNTILQKLPPKDRALVYSRAVECKSFEELQQIYGKKAATLRKRYERAKKKLAEELEQGGDL